MRFKVVFNEKTKKLEINCLTDNFSDVLLPENLDQHVCFPIPNNMINEAKQYIEQILYEDDKVALQEIYDQIINLTAKRRQIIYKYREKYNPLIIEKCQKFKDDHAEWFI